MKVEDKIAEELGEKIVKEIGSGDFGTVYLLESGKVLKFTSDPNEVIIAKKLTKNKNLFKYILNYYNVGEIESNKEYDYPSDNEKYFILMDYVEPISDEEYKIINFVYKSLLQFCKSFHKSVMTPSFLDYVVDQFSPTKIRNKYFLDRYSKPELEKMKKYAISLIPHIQNIAKELKLHHIEQCDFHGGNLGWNEDHTKLIIFDITKPYNPYAKQQPEPKLKKYAIFEYVKTPPTRLNKRIYEIANELGEEIDHYLGGEAFGHAFKTKSGKVLKLTSDWDEANLALKLSKNKRWFKYLVNFYNVGKIKPINKIPGLDDNIYEWFILMDYVYDITTDEKYALDCYTLAMQDNPNYYEEMLDKEEIINHIDCLLSEETGSYEWYRIKKGDKDPDKIKQIAKDLYPKVLNIAKELKKQHVRGADFHSGNVGWDKNHENLVFFDIGGESIGYNSKFKFKEIPTSEKFVIKFNKFNPNV